MKNPTFVITRAIAVAATISVAPIFSATAQNQDQLARGKYLVESIGGCGNCHTARGGPMKGVPLAGGNAFGGPKAPFHSYATNITPDRETGIGAWTDAQIKHAIAKGKRHDGSGLRPPMCYRCYDRMTDADLDAVVAYLRTVKPIRNAVR
jgi:mono/diheme cytochrome c family protein